MSIVSVQQTLDRGSSINEKFEVEYARQYMVITNSVADDELAVRAGCGVALFSAHPSDAFARCRSISARCVEKGFLDAASPGVVGCKWIVDVTWGYINPFEATASGDPSECPIEVVIEGVDEEKPADYDINGTPIKNSAGDPYDPTLTMDDQRVIIKIAQNRKDLTLDQILAYANKVNEAAWQGRDAKTCKMSQPRVTPKISMFLDVIYYRVEWTITYNPDGWKKKIPDQGFRSLDTSVSPPQLKTLLDRYGQPATEPFFLDGNGQPLALPIDKDSVVSLEFDLYKTADFDALGFPDNIFVKSPFG